MLNYLHKLLLEYSRTRQYIMEVFMQTIEILDIKLFMQFLFQTTALDTYEFISSELRTDMSYTLDGHINREFFTDDEQDALGIKDVSYLPWHIAKEKIFTLIKGKKTPSQLKIVLKADRTQTNSLLSSISSSFQENDIDGLFLNIIFQENKLDVICGISYKIFTMDKSLESAFFEETIALLKSYKITCQ